MLTLIPSSLFCDTGDRTQDLAYGRHVFYQSNILCPLINLTLSAWEYMKIKVKILIETVKYLKLPC